MALKLELDTLDGVAENLRELYSEKDGKFRLNVDGVEDVAPLKAKISELLGETKAEREKRKALETAQAAADEVRAKEKGEWREIAEKKEAELEKLRGEQAAFTAKIREKDIEGTAGTIAAELTRDTARAAILKKEAAALLKHTDDGVSYEIGGVPVDRAKVLDHLRTSYPFLADGSQASGGGASGGSGGAGTKKLGEMNDEERLALARDNPDAFRKMREAS